MHTARRSLEAVQWRLGAEALQKAGDSGREPSEIDHFFREEGFPRFNP